MEKTTPAATAAPIQFIESPTEAQRAGYQIWEDITANLTVTISEYRVKEDPVQIPGGDKLVGNLQEVQDQLRRRGFVRRSDLTLSKQ